MVSFLAEKCWGAKGKLWNGAWEEWVRGRVGWGRLRLGDRRVAEKRLEGAGVGAALEEVGSERMSEGVAGGSFWDVGFADRVSDLSLQRVLVQVVAGVFFGALVCAEFGGREAELPGPFTRGVGVFAGEGCVQCK